MDENQIRNLVQQEVQSMMSRYGVAQVPFHTHNGIDSPQLPQFQPASSGPSGVFSPKNIAPQQVVNLNPTTGIGNPNVQVMPVPIIYGAGGGVSSQFDGGDAPLGTIILFQNDPSVIQLWWRVYSTVAGAPRWYGVDVTSSPATALGPLA